MQQQQQQHSIEWLGATAQAEQTTHTEVNMEIAKLYSAL
jgi:hypothetical protein